MLILSRVCYIWFLCLKYKTVRNVLHFYDELSSVCIVWSCQQCLINFMRKYCEWFTRNSGIIISWGLSSSFFHECVLIILGISRKVAKLKTFTWRVSIPPLGIIFRVLLANLRSVILYELLNMFSWNFLLIIMVNYSGNHYMKQKFTAWCLFLGTMWNEVFFGQFKGM